MTLRLEGINVDCRDAARAATFWAAVFGDEVHGPDADGLAWLDATDAHPEILFIPVPEPKSVKNRLHLDLRPDDQATEVERLLGLGARRVDVGQGDAVSWVVMADVEGNEFCVLQAERPDAG
jgi:predicted enzyme related to lactoylglutathione lyase